MVQHKGPLQMQSLILDVSAFKTVTQKKKKNTAKTNKQTKAPNFYYLEITESVMFWHNQERM